jgi:hypothetical protein
VGSKVRSLVGGCGQLLNLCELQIDQTDKLFGERQNSEVGLAQRPLQKPKQSVTAPIGAGGCS